MERTRRHQHTGKAVAFLNAIGQLRKLDSNATVIDRRSGVSSDEFRDRYYAGNRPVVLRDLISQWRAIQTWTPAYLKQVLGDMTVEVMTGRDADPHFVMNSARHRTSMRFADYIDKVNSGRVTNDYNLVANNGFFQRFATQGLLADISPPLPYLRPAPDGEQCFLWFGPAGTLTPLHHDTSNIIFAQIAGRKRFRLIPPSDWQYVYNGSGAFSDVDVESPDPVRHPRFRDATVIDLTLEPGEVLFLPVGWWHHVRSLSVSLSVSFTNFRYPNHFDWNPAT
jgi:Cupin-like domain